MQEAKKCAQDAHRASKVGSRVSFLGIWGHLHHHRRVVTRGASTHCGTDHRARIDLIHHAGGLQSSQCIDHRSPSIESCHCECYHEIGKVSLGAGAGTVIEAMGNSWIFLLVELVELAALPILIFPVLHGMKWRPEKGGKEQEKKRQNGGESKRADCVSR